MQSTRRSFLTAAAAGTAAVATQALALDKWGRDRDWTGNTPVTYPEPAFEVMDKKFKGRQGNAKLERLWTGALWLEGPVYMGDWKCFVCSDIPNQRILKWEEETGNVSIFRKPSNFANGNLLLSWYVGGLNYQIEHHLFPRVCSVHYPALSGLVREVARRHGVPYNEHRTLFDAVASHYRTLKRLGSAGSISALPMARGPDLGQTSTAQAALRS